MDNFNLKKYLAEGKLLKEDENQEELNFTKEIEGELYLDTDKLKTFLTSLGYREDEVDEYVSETEDIGEYEPYQSTTQDLISDDFEFTEGSVGFARSTEFDSEDSEFFITLKDIPIYQGEYTPLGKVKFGLDILKKIKTGNKAIYVLRPDYINTFRILETN